MFTFLGCIKFGEVFATLVATVDVDDEIHDIFDWFMIRLRKADVLRSSTGSSLIFNVP